jgi:hypothetical protein
MSHLDTSLPRGGSARWGWRRSVCWGHALRISSRTVSTSRHCLRTSCFCEIQVDNLASVTEVSLAWSVGYGSNQARLTTRFRFSVTTWIGHAAAVIGGHWGAVSQCAAEVGCSREAMYQQRRRVEQAVARAHTGGPRYDELCNENKHLRDEDQALWTVALKISQAAGAATGSRDTRYPRCSIRRASRSTV